MRVMIIDIVVLGVVNCQGGSMDTSKEHQVWKLWK